MRRLKFSGILRYKTYHLILARRADLVIILEKTHAHTHTHTKKKKTKRTCQILDFTVPMDHRMKSEKMKRQILRTCQRTKKTMKHEGNGDTNCN